MNAKEFINEIKLKAVSIFNEDSLLEKLESGKKLTIKFGADPSRPDLHLGHTVPLRVLKKFQELGHNVVFIIGDYTGMIGDPSGKSKTRPSLTYEQTRQSGATYFQQVSKILDINKTKIVYNSEWLSKLTFADTLKLAGKYTVARLLERDDFANRFKANVPIGMHELLYPLMQGYDSVAIDADIEIGGTDQTFNMLVGRALKPDYGLSAQEVITFPLLVGLDGKQKMSKSLDNYIGISEIPSLMFEKCMKVPDDCLKNYFILTTDISLEKINEIMKDIREAHFVYATEIVKIYHSEKDAIEAKERYLTVAKGSLPTEMKECFSSEKQISLIDALILAGFAASKSEARKLIQGNGVKVNNEKINAIDFVLDLSEAVIVSKGKANFAKITNENK
ncbi:MAG: tyrosine--tRNA ligase [Clostridia bacterium]